MPLDRHPFLWRLPIAKGGQNRGEDRARTLARTSIPRGAIVVADGQDLAISLIVSAAWPSLWPSTGCQTHRL